MGDDLKGKTCCHTKFGGFGFNDKRCGNPAKMTHEGKPFCGVHDPVKRQAKWAAESDANRAKWAALDTRRELETSSGVASLTNAELLSIIAAGGIKAVLAAVTKDKGN